MTRRIQTEGPLIGNESLHSNFENRVFRHLLIMGYEAIQHFDSGHGLHIIDLVLLPSAKVPCKIAIEADGKPHFLHEDCRLDKSPNLATR